MLYVYIIYIFGYPLGSRFSYFCYRKIGTIRVYESFGAIPVSGISVQFLFNSLVPIFFFPAYTHH